MNMQDIYETEEWTDEQWRERLRGLDNRELALLWAATWGFNPACYGSVELNARALDTFAHARHCMLGEVLDRMGEV